MKLSARNKLAGVVSGIKEGGVEAQVSVDIGGQTITAVVTVDAVKELGLAPGSKVIAIVKADSVLLATE